VSKRDRRSYEAMRVRLRGARAHLPAVVSEGGIAGPAGAAAPDETQSKMEADDAEAAAAARVGTAPAGGGEGEGMEGTDDAPEPEDPMKDD
jgi:hypothetical protein